MTRAFAVAMVCVALGGGACGDDGDTAETGPTGVGGAEPAQRTPLPSEVAERVRSEVLIEQQRLSPSEAECALEQLAETLTAEQVAEAERSGTLPPAVTAAAFEAGVRCAGR